MSSSTSSRCSRSKSFASVDQWLLLPFIENAIETTLRRFLPIVEDSVRKVVKEEIRSVNESRDGCNRMLTQRLDVIECTLITIPSTVETCVRKVVKEEIQAPKGRGSDGSYRNCTNATVNLSNERNLHLKFIGEPGDALTGKEIRGKGNDDPISVAIVDEATGKVVENGPGSLAKVEIFLKSENYDEGKIIMESDKTKPRLAKPYHIQLEKGIGVLSNVKLANDKGWSKSCKCLLGARVVGSFSGIKVQEAWTPSFDVSDSRSKLYGKRYPPYPFDPVWRLLNIGKDGAPCKRLRENNINTVEDFIVFNHVQPETLKKLTKTGDANFQATVDHALTCKIDDKKICVFTDSSEPNMCAVFDGNELKGVIRDCKYVPSHGLSEPEMKSRALKLKNSAGENPKKRKYVSSETVLETVFPCGASDDVPNTSVQGSVSAGCNPKLETSPAEAPELVGDVSHQQEEHNNNVNPAQGNLSGLTGSRDETTLAPDDVLNTYYILGNVPDGCNPEIVTSKAEATALAGVASLLLEDHDNNVNPAHDNRESDVEAMANSFSTECLQDPVSEPNANQERGDEGCNGGGAGSSRHFSPCLSEIHLARNNRMQDRVPGYNLTIPQNSTHCQTTDSAPSIRSLGEANNNLDSESRGLSAIEQVDTLSPNEFRSQGYKDCEKRDIPSLTDEVWRLANICKDGDIHKRLRFFGIEMVEHFLIQLRIDSQRLERIVQMEAEEWMATVKNAEAFRDKKVYCYVDSERKAGIIFTLGRVLRLFYQKAPDNFQAITEELQASAYKNWNAVQHFKDETNLGEYFIELNKDWDSMDSQVLIMPSVASSSLNPNTGFGSQCSDMETNFAGLISSFSGMDLPEFSSFSDMDFDEFNSLPSSLQ